MNLNEIMVDNVVYEGRAYEIEDENAFLILFVFLGAHPNNINVDQTVHYMAGHNDDMVPYQVIWSGTLGGRFCCIAEY